MSVWRVSLKKSELSLLLPHIIPPFKNLALIKPFAMGNFSHIMLLYAAAAAAIARERNRERENQSPTKNAISAVSISFQVCVCVYCAPNAFMSMARKKKS